MFDPNLTPQTSTKAESESSSTVSSTVDSEKNPLWFARLQEVLLMHRPFDFCVLLISVELIFGFVYFHHLGIFATTALLSLIAFMFFIQFYHPNPLLEKIFFPPLAKPIDQTQPNRIRSYSEFSKAITSIHQGFSHYFGHKQLTGIKRAVFGISSFIFALLLKRVAPFWVNFLLVHGILFLPAAILRPWPTKDLPNDEQNTSESLPQPTTNANTETNQPKPTETETSTETQQVTVESTENKINQEVPTEIPKPEINPTTPILEKNETIDTPAMNQNSIAPTPIINETSDPFKTPVTNRNVTINQPQPQPAQVVAPNTEPKPKPKFSFIKKKNANQEKESFSTPKTKSKKGK